MTTTKAMTKAMELVAEREEGLAAVSMARAREDRDKKEGRLREVTRLLADADGDLEAWTALDAEQRALRGAIADAGQALSEASRVEAVHIRVTQQARDELSAVVRAEYESGSRKSFERIAVLVREALAELDSADELGAELARLAGLPPPLDGLAVRLRRQLIEAGMTADWKVVSPDGAPVGFASSAMWEERRRAS